MADLRIPGIDPKYNKIVIIILVVILLVVFLPDIIKGLIKGIGSGIGSVLDIGQGPTAGEKSVSDDIQWLGNYEAHRNSSDCFGVNLYDNNSKDATIDSATAEHLWQNVKDCNGWFSNDMSTLKDKFMQVVGNQIDISFVSRKCMDDKGKDLFRYMAYTFDDDANYHWLNQFIQWANSLPTY